MNPNEVSFRRMTVRDVDHVMNIEKASFTAPWSRNAFWVN